MASPRYSPLKRAPPTKQRMLRKNLGTEKHPFWTPARFQSPDERLARFIVANQIGKKNIDFYRFKPVPPTPEMINDLARLSEKRKRNDGKYQQAVHSINDAVKVIPDALLVRSMLAAHGENRLPSIYEVAAMCVLRYGIDSPKLVEYVANMKKLYLVQGVQSYWHSTPEALKDALHPYKGRARSIVVETEDILRKAGVRTMNTHQLAHEMGLPYSLSVRVQLSAALKLLSVSQYIHDQPESKTPAEKQFSVNWSHRAHPNPAPDSNAPYIRILNWFTQGKIGTGKLSFYIFTPAGKKIPIPRMQYRSFAFLQKHGLVEREEKTKLWKLTKEGKRLMQRSTKRGELNEKLRKILSNKNQRKGIKWRE